MVISRGVSWRLVSIFTVLVVLGLLWQPAAHSQNTSTDIWSVDWSPDGNYLAVGYEFGTVQVLDAVTHQSLTVFQLPGGKPRAQSVAWSPDGSLLAIGAFNGAIFFWDRSTGHLSSYSAGDRVVDFVAWSPDGTRLAYAFQNGYAGQPLCGVRVLNVSTNDLVFTRPYVDIVDSVAWSPDGSRLALTEMEYLTILNTSTWTVDVNLYLPKYSPMKVDWSPDSTRLSTIGPGDDTVTIWTADGEPQIIIPITLSLDARWSPDGTRIAIADAHEIRIVDSQTGEDLYSVPMTVLSTNEITWSPDGTELAYGDSSGNVYFADATGLPPVTPTPEQTPQSALTDSS
jgi:WD40 repeat protein